MRLQIILPWTNLRLLINWSNEVLKAVEMLQKFPQLGSLPTELCGLPYRQLVVRPCRIFYRVEKKVVYVVHVLRGEQLVRRESFPAQPRVSESPGK